MIDNEKYVDLTKFEELYEEGKKCLANCKPPFDERAQYHSRLYEILREMWDIAEIKLRTNKGGNTHEITIKDSDRIIITVESQFVSDVTKTMLSPTGIKTEQGPRGFMYHTVDWNIENDFYD